MEIVHNYWPHAIGLIVLSACAYVIKHYAQKAIHVIDNAVTHRELEKAMNQFEQRIDESEHRTDTDIGKLQDDLKKSYNTMSEQLTTGFNRVHERIDNYFDRRNDGR